VKWKNLYFGSYFHSKLIRKGVKSILYVFLCMPILWAASSRRTLLCASLNRYEPFRILRYCYRNVDSTIDQNSSVYRKVLIFVPLLVLHSTWLLDCRFSCKIAAFLAIVSRQMVQKGNCCLQVRPVKLSLPADSLSVKPAFPIPDASKRIRYSCVYLLARIFTILLTGLRSDTEPRARSQEKTALRRFPNR
jgi:hypothetical protein